MPLFRAFVHTDAGLCELAYPHPTRHRNPGTPFHSPLSVDVVTGDQRDDSSRPLLPAPLQVDRVRHRHEPQATPVSRSNELAGCPSAVLAKPPDPPRIAYPTSTIRMCSPSHPVTSPQVRDDREPGRRIELLTCSLRVSRSAD
jgi:hypothetical protein